MAKSNGKGQGSGVSFTPDASYAGPYNYTRADVPIYAPGTGYNQTLPPPPGDPAAPPPTAPGKKPRTPRTPRAGGGGGAGRAMGGGSGRVGGGMAKGLGPSPHNAFTGNGQNAAHLKNGGRPRNSFDFSSSLHDRGELPRMAVNQTGMGMALGGAGRFATPRPATTQALPMPSVQPGQLPAIRSPSTPITAGNLPTQGVSDMMYRVPPGTTPPGMPRMPSNPPPMQKIAVPSTGGGGMPTTMPTNKPAIIGNANPGMPGRSGMAPPRTGVLPNGKPFPGQAFGQNPNRNDFGSAQSRARYANALANGAFKGR